jgi:hypothetical protein
MRVANASLAPTHGPYHVKRAVWSLADGRIAHQFVTPHLRFQKRFALRDFLPLVAIAAVEQMQTIFTVADKVREQIMTLSNFVGFGQ